MEKFGAKIKQLRFNKGLSQDEVGKGIGIDRSVISKWERDIKEPSLDQLQLICKFYNVDLDYFLSNVKQTKGSKKDNNIEKVVIVLAISLFGIFVGPLGCIMHVLCIIYSFKTKMSLVVKLLLILMMLYNLGGVLFLLGINPPSIIIIS